MLEEQRRFLIGDFQEFVDDARTDAVAEAEKREDQAAPLSPDPYVEGFVLALDWLRGRVSPNDELRDFFIGRLEIFEREVGYRPLAKEREALAAAVEDLQ